MTNHFVMDIVFNAIAVAFIVQGLYVLVRRKPLIVSFNWYLVLMVLIFGLPLVNDFTLSQKSSMLFAVFIIVLLSYFIYNMRGYMILGADSDDFERKLISTLQENNYNFQQTINRVIIQNPPMEISLAFTGLAGNGQLRLRTKGYSKELAAIVQQLRTKDIRISLFMPVFMIISGGLLLGMRLMWHY